MAKFGAQRCRQGSDGQTDTCVNLLKYRGRGEIGSTGGCENVVHLLA